jgi:hypothetical protein
MPTCTCLIIPDVCVYACISRALSWDEIEMGVNHVLTRRRWLSVSANEHASVFWGADPMGKPARHRTPCPLHVARPNARS